MKVYLAGAINGCTDEECRGWREQAKKLLFDCEILDPMARDYRGKEASNVAAIVNGDLEDIMQSDVLLVKASKPSWGTAMEIALAKVVHCRRVVVFDAGPRPSPWLLHFSEVFATLEEACAAIQGG